MSGQTSHTSLPTLSRFEQAYFPNAVQDEVLARLRYLVEHHHRLGLLLGPSGSGKSTVLQTLADELSRYGHQVVLTSLLGRENIEFVAALAGGLECFVDDLATLPALWRQVTERLRENRYQKRTTVFLLDDADEAEMDVLTSVTRLVQADFSPQANYTVIVSCHSSRAQLLGPRLRELCELRIELECWGPAETEAFVQRYTPAEQAFDAEAISVLHELSGGLPRRLGHLTELSLLAGAELTGPIDATTVESAFRELSPLGNDRDN